MYNFSTVNDRRKPLRKDGYLPLHEYLKMAESYIKRICKQYYLKRNMLASEDAISFVAEKLMMGDGRYDPDKNVKQNTYRYKCAQWAINVYLKSNKNKKNVKCWSIDFQSIPDNPRSSLARAIINENRIYGVSVTPQDVTDKVNFALENSGLTQNQINLVKMRYLEEKKYRDIAKETGKTHQSVCQSVKKAIRKMRIRMGKDE